MYVGVDIGGTKTLVAALDDAGVIVERIRFPTPHDYSAFLAQLHAAAASLKTSDFRAGCVGAPGKIDRTRGVGLDFGNLPWHDVPIQAASEVIFHCPMLVENDANLGGLSESMLLPPDKRVLYVTVSTGIGTGFVDHQTLSPALIDSEGGHMQLEYRGRRMAWEDFASGRAVLKRFGKKASEITDQATWQRIAHDIAIGLIELMAVAQPDIIVLGGSVGGYFARFESYLLQEIEQYHSPLVTVPLIKQAARPADAVIYGCYDLAHRRYAPRA